MCVTEKKVNCCNTCGYCIESFLSMDFGRIHYSSLNDYKYSDASDIKLIAEDFADYNHPDLSPLE